MEVTTPPPPSLEELEARIKDISDLVEFDVTACEERDVKPLKHMVLKMRNEGRLMNMRELVNVYLQRLSLRGQSKTCHWAAADVFMKRGCRLCHCVSCL